MSQFVQMYHPNLPETITEPVWVAVRAVDDQSARGWLLVNGGPLPEPTLPYYTRPQADSRFLTEDAAREAFAHLEGGVLVIAGQPVGGGGGGVGAPVPDSLDPDLYVFPAGVLVPDSTDSDLYVFAAA